VAQVLGSGPCRAADDPRFAVDRFEPSERGSEWFANESLNLTGTVRPSIGVATAYSYRAIVAQSADGTATRSPVRNLATLHAGGSVVLVDRLRLALDLPFQIFADGRSATVKGTLFPAPLNEQGIGDFRFGADVRIFGKHGEPVTAAVGAQLWAPTGQQAQWATDGVWRVRPRALVAGDVGRFVYAAQLGFAFRERSELGLSAAAGVRFIQRIVVGPEVFAATATDDGSTAIEALLGAHFLIDAGRVGAAVGRGFSGLGSPAARVLLTFEWSAEASALREVPKPVPVHVPEPRDADRDRVPDGLDACPKIMGIATPDNARTNGCPPDTDGDGIDDLEDACPTVAGPRTSDPRTTGCPD
jgi:hypothetical protein